MQCIANVPRSPPLTPARSSSCLPVWLSVCLSAKSPEINFYVRPNSFRQKPQIHACAWLSSFVVRFLEEYSKSLTKIIAEVCGCHARSLRSMKSKWKKINSFTSNLFSSVFAWKFFLKQNSFIRHALTGYSRIVMLPRRL